MSLKIDSKQLLSHPIHPYLLAAYVPLAMYALNSNEVSADTVVRPLIAALALGAALHLSGWVFFRHWQRAGLAATLVLFLFAAYGHLYDAFKASSSLNPYARHRFFIPVFAILLVFGLAVLFWKKLRPRELTIILNLYMAFLLAFPIIQTTIGAITATRSAKEITQFPLSIESASKPPVHLPSVYFIVMDTYMRSDTLMRELQMDNSGFVSDLERLGFYVPTCSRANYDETQSALTATLNMDYLDHLRADLAEQGQEYNVTTLIKHSRVRQQLESLGYQTIAFDSGYEWSRIYDAGSYLALGKDGIATQSLNPFELMLVKSTALRLLTDYLIDFEQSAFQLPSSQFNDHINLERYILTSLPRLASQPGPDFVFAHLLIPHWPYIFLPDGSIRDDPIYATENLTDAQRAIGYRDSVQFLNGQIVNIVEKILKDSPTPPVILLMGDHGLIGDTRLENFSAIYLPGGSQNGLYAGISEINYFRAVFNTVFGTNYPLLPDNSYRLRKGGKLNPVPETAPGCHP